MKKRREAQTSMRDWSRLGAVATDKASHRTNPVCFSMVVQLGTFWLKYVPPLFYPFVPRNSLFLAAYSWCNPCAGLHRTGLLPPKTTVFRSLPEGRVPGQGRLEFLPSDNSGTVSPALKAMILEWWSSTTILQIGYLGITVWGPGSSLLVSKYQSNSKQNGFYKGNDETTKKTETKSKKTKIIEMASNKWIK